MRRPSKRVEGGRRRSKRVEVGRSGSQGVRFDALRLSSTLLVVAAGATAPAGAQEPAASRCLLELERPLLREGTRIEVSPGVINFFGGGDARFRCRNQNIRMRSDSVASYQGSVVQFVGHVRYQDSTIEMTADFGTYFRDGEKWEARGNVVLTNLKDGSTLRGPSLDYWRAIRGFKDTAEMYADQRPTITMPVKDSATGQTSEPYVIVGDRVRTRGNERVYAAGRVTIDRSDFRGRADSLSLDSGAGNSGALIGSASLRRVASDSFDLVGRRIDLALEQRELSFVTARDSARLNSGQLQLVGDGIGLDVNARKVEQTLAWGKDVRPFALSSDYEIRGDSLAFDTPEQKLKEIRAFGDAWIGAKPDSGTGDRDWIAGQKVVAAFVDRDSAGKPRPTLQSVVATGAARALYRLRQAGQAQASISYNKAREIRITMRVTPDSVGVADVTAIGDVEGIHLQPQPPRARPDSVKADSVKADTTAVRLSPVARRLSPFAPRPGR